MEDTSLTPNTQATAPQNPPPVLPKPRGTFALWGAAAIAIIIGVSALAAWQSLARGRTTLTAPSPTPAATVTPTPIRQLSALASQSAFLSLETAVASLSSQVQNFQTEDPSLNPPVLELPLGLDQ